MRSILCLLIAAAICPAVQAALLGEYFNTTELTELATTRVDETVDFTDWPGDAPTGAAVTPDSEFSERWTGYVRLDAPGEWTFYTISNDGVRLWVDDQPLIDNWGSHTATEDAGAISLAAGWHPIRLEHFQRNGSVVIQLFFSGPGQSRTIIPSGHTSPDSPGLPIVDAGPDQYLFLPESQIVLSGSASDENGRIVHYHWTQTDGSPAILDGADTPTLTVSDLAEGRYAFQLTVTDDDGNTAADEATVYVSEPAGEPGVSGELKKWHCVTLTFEGPWTSEAADPNPFTDYRLDVVFVRPSGSTLRVPGFYAADGQAADTSADAGNRWRVHLTPDEEGEWRYLASFRTGDNIAISLDPDAGQPAGYCHGAAGTLAIGPTDKTAPDYRAKGLLRYVDKHHLQFAETGEYYLKGGADSPENFLGYWEFDGTFDTGGLSTGGLIDGLHRYAPHVQDWRAGDPVWQGGKGKGIIGALNYLSAQGMNSVYFLTYNIDGGDGRDTWMWTSPEERRRFDVSKLAQWEIVFQHMDVSGIQLHVVTQETENDTRLGGSGSLNDVRKLYYRELVARFAHHLAVIWNLGEENDNSDADRKAFAQYIRALDPCDHPITVHTHNGRADTFYDGLLGHEAFEATSIQGSGSDYNRWAVSLRQRSAAAGRKWAIYGDEQGPAVDDSMSNLDALRKGALWGNLMGGGAGVEWYWGYQGTFGDVQSESWRVAEPLWQMTRHALDFFQTHLPFSEMEPANDVTPATGDYVLALADRLYVVYLPSGGEPEIDLPEGIFTVRWYDPRNGGDLQPGQPRRIEGPGRVQVGPPPAEPGQDWVLLLDRAGLRPRGDLNADGRVDLEDLALFTTKWLESSALTASIAYPTPNAPSVPAIAITWPDDGDILSGAPAGINAVAWNRLDPTATDGSGIDHVLFELLDAQAQIVADHTENLAPYDWSDLNTAAFPDGSYTLRATAAGDTHPTYRDCHQISITIDHSPQ